MFGTKDKKKRAPCSPHEESLDFQYFMTVSILGSAESGKTTAMRQFQFLAEQNMLEHQKYFRNLLYGNTLDTLHNLLAVAEQHNFTLGPDAQERVARIKDIDPTEFKPSRFPLRLVYDFKCLWEDQAIQSAYSVSHTDYTLHIPGRPVYYMENIFRILAPEFRPSEDDILNAYDQVDTTHVETVVYRRLKITINCHPGEVSDYRKWITHCDASDACIYCLNISTYDQIIKAKDSNLNVLHVATQIFNEFLDSHAYATASYVFLFLNFLDIFNTKATQIDLKCCFSDYTGGLDHDKALAYIHQYYSQKLSVKGKPFKIYSTSSIDKVSMIPTIDDVIDKCLPKLITNDPGQHSPPLPRAHSSDSSSGSFGRNSKSREVLNGIHSAIMEKKKKKVKKLVAVEFGVDSQQGRRKHMEDCHVIVEDFRTEFPMHTHQTGQCSYFAVYDGHGGAETAKVIETLLHKNILEDARMTQPDAIAAIKNGFAKTDTHVLTLPSKSGSTAVVCIVVGNQLYVANAGDSEGILGRCVGAGKKAKAEHMVLTYKHTPTDEGEKQRITSAGGMVVFGRLFGSLAVSRAFGDKDYKEGQSYVSAEPYIKQVELTPEDQFVVLACDGLWDKVNYEEVIETCNRLRKEGKTANEISKALVQQALDKDSMDNVTVVSAFFQWKK
eukprot:TRINITY_DN6033_c0_g2_i1.p1 TRINITY_DN6033_c0_g2~~TRINITY_DN6033_c0_g2_i1.p1  ORF type:complete len:667 (-),score=102.00 TRINITY_DN6033_c0_g2_i1:183-2183(-)